MSKFKPLSWKVAFQTYNSLVWSRRNIAFWPIINRLLFWNLKLKLNLNWNYILTNKLNDLKSPLLFVELSIYYLFLLLQYSWKIRKLQIVIFRNLSKISFLIKYFFVFTWDTVDFIWLSQDFWTLLYDLKNLSVTRSFTKIEKIIRLFKKKTIFKIRSRSHSRT